MIDILAGRVSYTLTSVCVCHDVVDFSTCEFLVGHCVNLSLFADNELVQA